MKKTKNILMTAFILLLCTCVWFYAYSARKSKAHIPDKEWMVSYYRSQGEDQATQILRGYQNTQLMEVWGKPDGSLFGFWGDIWETGNGGNLFIYYDRDGRVEYVKVFVEEDAPDMPAARIPSGICAGQL